MGLRADLRLRRVVYSFGADASANGEGASARKQAQGLRFDLCERIEHGQETM